MIPPCALLLFALLFETAGAWNLCDFYTHFRARCILSAAFTHCYSFILLDLAETRKRVRSGSVGRETRRAFRIVCCLEDVGMFPVLPTCLGHSFGQGGVLVALASFFPFALHRFLRSFVLHLHFLHSWVGFWARGHGVAWLDRTHTGGVDTYLRHVWRQ